MFKFIHTADIHLDSPLRGLEQYEGAPVAEIRGSTRRALQNLVALAIEERVAFVLIAGDLYDGDWPDYGTGLFLKYQMEQLRDAAIRVFVIQGNHDAANLMTKSLTLPDNVRMLSTKSPESVGLDDLGVVIHGQGFATRAVKDNIVRAYPNAVPGAFNIGMLHTCATGRDGHESYAPCSLDDLRSREYDYWALGHVHQYERLHGDPPILFSGNIQGRHARETGAKGCVLVTVNDRGRAQHEQRPLDVLRWERCRVDCTGASVEDVLERAAQRLRSGLESCDDRLMAARLEIVGACGSHEAFAAEPDRWTNEFRGLARDVGGGRIWVEKVKLQTAPAHSVDTTDGPIGELFRFLDELRDDEPGLVRLAAELSDLKKKLPRELREGDSAIDLDSSEHLREVLSQVGPMVLRGVLAPEGTP
jgi:DNA repair exonuclease SbcCD nuclease subunit